ncbi:MAG: metallophosphoesterase, partial [Oscillospiraceae bacterium]|nr:metallophosphoesterase [Oscillospiraceae bacterium]
MSTRKSMAVLLLFSIMLSLLPLTAVAAPVSGRSFQANEMLRLDRTFTTMPNTFEAWVYFPKDTAASTRGGVILGNYKGSSTNEINFEIYTNGNPRIYYIDGSGAAHSKVFTGVNVYNGQWTHLAVVRNKSANTLSCYVNGALAESCSMTIPNIIPATPLQLGGDYRSSNNLYFKGQIASAAVYKDARTEAEIRLDMEQTGTGDPLCAWDLSSNSLSYTDLSGNGYHIAAGDTFTAGSVYKTRKTVTAMPNTFEAWLHFPKDTSPTSRGGVILGNFKDGTTNTTNFEIYTNGNPRIYYCDGNGKTVSHVFTKVNVYTGNWLHLTVVRNASSGTVSCYVNGSLKENAPLSVGNFNPYRGLVVGGDHRSGNTAYFKGRLRAVAIYSDVRSQTEIKADMTTVNNGDPMGFWEIGASNVSCYPDLSGNGNHAAVGKGFEANLQYRTDKALTAMPNTVEAWLYFGKSPDPTIRGGTIFSNYPASGQNLVSFEIYTNGNPRVYCKGPDGTTYTKTFTDVNVYRGEWLHIAFVRSTKNSLIGCYINGVLEQSISFSMPDFIPMGPFTVGGDQRGDNSQYFKGVLSAVAAYSDVRNTKELKADIHCMGNGDPLVCWNVSKNQESYPDLSNRGNHLRRLTTWLAPSEKAAVTDFDYTFAVVGDTQKITEADTLNNTKNLNKLYDWILSQKDSKNIQYVMGLGDITENGAVEAEWKLALNAVNKLNGKIPYSLVRGNHDKSNAFNKYFGDPSLTGYSSSLEGSYDGKLDNAWRTVTVGTEQIPYLIMGLDFGPTDGVLDWASSVIEAHPDHNVIITTHAYLLSDGSHLSSTATVAPTASNANANNGDMMWEKLVKKHENISMVICGHVPCAQIMVRQDTGDHGNEVTQILIDPQNVDTMIPTGSVALFHFSRDGRRVQVEYYSTLQEKYYLSTNQFEVNVHVVGRVKEPIQDDSLKINHTLDLASDISI